jgi:hypothetical protein
MLEPIQYIFLGVIGFTALIWAFSSMGVIKPRDHELYNEKRRHLRMAENTIEQTYHYLANLPKEARSEVFKHLDRGFLSYAHTTAKTKHDIFSFFKQM